MEYNYKKLEADVLAKESAKKNDDLIKRAKEAGLNLDEYKKEVEESKETEKKSVDGEGEQKSSSKSNVESNDAMAKAISDGIAKALKEISGNDKKEEAPEVSL